MMPSKINSCLYILPLLISVNVFADPADDRLPVPTVLAAPPADYYSTWAQDPNKPGEGTAEYHDKSGTVYASLGYKDGIYVGPCVYYSRGSKNKERCNGDINVNVVDLMNPKRTSDEQLEKFFRHSNLGACFTFKAVITDYYNIPGLMGPQGKIIDSGLEYGASFMSNRPHSDISFEKSLWAQIRREYGEGHLNICFEALAMKSGPATLDHEYFIQMLKGSTLNPDASNPIFSGQGNNNSPGSKTD